MFFSIRTPFNTGAFLTFKIIMFTFKSYCSHLQCQIQIKIEFTPGLHIEHAYLQKILKRKVF